jgi:Ni,Fe-hydrogenase III component G
MTTEVTLQSASSLLAPWAKGTKVPEANRLDVLIHAGDLLDAVKALLDARWGYLVAITALDTLGKEAQLANDERAKALPNAAGAIEVLYFFSAGPAMVTLRMLLAREAPAIASVCGLIPAASFFERELAEMFGITVVNTPDANHLFLSDDWPANTYPLRKDFVTLKNE